jgi:hypothetical protein
MQMHPEGRSQDLEFYWRRYPGGFKIVRNQPQVECGLCLRLLVDKHQPTVLEFDRVGEVDIAHMMAEAGIYGRAYSYRCNRAVIISEYLVDVSPMYLEEDRPHLRACRLFTGVTFTPQGRPPCGYRCICAGTGNSKPTGSVSDH